MKTRLVLLLVVVALAAAPVALADHCKACRNGKCSFAVTGGYQSCTQLANGCSLSGTCGGPHPFIEVEPLAAEFEIISVERLDDGPQQPGASETRVASLEETPQPDARR